LKEKIIDVVYEIGWSEISKFFNSNFEVV